MRSYQELIRLASFEDRLRYLMLGGAVGRDTFGYDRYLNQAFYRDKSWANVRRAAILRDNGFDLGCPDRPIGGFVFVHHIEPITKEDILAHSDALLDLDNLICCSKDTHDRIHYGNERCIKPDYVERKPYDTVPWKH